MSIEIPIESMSATPQTSWVDPVAPSKRQHIDLERQKTIESSKVFRGSDTGDCTAEEDHYLHGSNLILCFLALNSRLFLFSLDQTIVATILTTVGSKFDSFSNMGWISSAFMFGKLSIIFGRKWAMIVAIVLFQDGSLVCTLANSMNILIGGRVLAGIGGAGINSGVYVIVCEVVPNHKMSIALSVFSVRFAIASVLGPLIGGTFTSNVTWRSAFYINLSIWGVVLLVFLYSFRPPKPKVDTRQELLKSDYFGTFLLISGCVVFLLALTFGTSEFSWDSGAVISCFVLGPVLLILFTIWNFGFSKNQIVATEIVKIPQLMASCFSLAGIFATYIVTMLYGSIYFQLIKDSTPLGAGLHLLPMVISTAVAVLITGSIAQKPGVMKPFIIFAGAIGVVGAGLMALLDISSGFSQETGFFILAGASTGVMTPPSSLSVPLKAPKTASGMSNTTVFINFLRSILTVLGAILADAVFTVSFKNKLRESLSKLTDRTVLQELQKLDFHEILASTETSKTLSPQTEDFAKSQIMQAIRNVFYSTIGFAAISLLASPFVTNRKLPKEVEIKPKAEEKADPVGIDNTKDRTKDEIIEVTDEIAVENSELSDSLESSASSLNKEEDVYIMSRRVLHLLKTEETRANM